jgi:hypothetical protein
MMTYVNKVRLIILALAHTTCNHYRCEDGRLLIISENNSPAEYDLSCFMSPKSSYSPVYVSVQPDFSCRTSM